MDMTRFTGCTRKQSEKREFRDAGVIENGTKVQYKTMGRCQPQNDNMNKLILPGIVHLCIRCTVESFTLVTHDSKFKASVSTCALILPY
ncbi:hypothetical protein T265_11619 [Opisthorchis viverrini]|uniref:Uncharacterized protein n=1 Tax=Opisthorchis viverrini TaxID=6198 RepID=A0A074Z8X8_OPIVI|nr:hypothetical protein T265_11619 [Opisthorchis viverrini]KER19670.1 hypothetical protein T265_11619 [Opisthorchis viverrini]